MKAKGIKPKKKNINPEFIILYVKPLSIFSSICPLKIFAANLNPSDTALAKYDMNSIITNRGNKAKGQPEGTNKEKKRNPCLLNPKIVAPITTVKLIENVSTKCAVAAKL